MGRRGDRSKVSAYLIPARGLKREFVGFTHYPTREGFRISNPRKGTETNTPESMNQAITIKVSAYLIPARGLKPPLSRRNVTYG